MPPPFAGHLMHRVRGLVRGRMLAPLHTAILDHMLFSATPRGADRCQVSYAAMNHNLHVRRADLVAGVADLEHLGFIRKIKAWVWVEWQGLRVKRQAANTYVFIEPRRKPPAEPRMPLPFPVPPPPPFPARPPPEFPGGTPLQDWKKQEDQQPVARQAFPALEAALRVLGESMFGRRLE